MGTAAPTTDAPTSAAPTTTKPTTAAPVTAAPVTASPITAAPTPTTSTCRWVGASAGNDEWCINNCSHVPPYCPPSHCDCSGTSSPTTSSPTSASPTTASPTGDSEKDVDVSMQLTISGNKKKFKNDANSFTNGDIDALATDLLRFAISDAVGVSIRIDGVLRSTVKGFTSIEYTLTASPTAINDAIQSITEKVDVGAVYQHTAGVSRQFVIVANNGATPFPTESQNGPMTPAPVTPISTATMDLTIAGRKPQFEQEASEYAFGDSIAYARQVIEFGIEPAQNGIEVEVLSVLRGSVTKTIVIEYTLSSVSSAALAEAVSNIDDKASEGAVFQFYFGGSREWPFLNNQQASLALLNDEATDDGALDLLDEAESDAKGNNVWVIAVAVAVSVIVCGAVFALVHRKRRASKMVAFDHVAAEMTIVSEVAPTEGTTELVSEII